MEGEGSREKNVIFKVQVRVQILLKVLQALIEGTLRSASAGRGLKAVGLGA